MKVKLFVFSDVHGEHEALIQGLREAGYDSSNPSHKLVCIGDLFDRGPGSKKLFDIMMRGQNIWVKGNHEIMLEEALEKGMDGEFVFFNMLHNGLDKTISSFSDYNLDGLVSMEQLELAIKRARTHTRGGKTVLSVLKTLPLYYETKNYIFVHAGLDPYVYDWKLTPEDFMTWDIEASCLPIESTRKTVIIGHHHAFRVRAQGEEKGWAPEHIGIPYYGNNDEHAPVRFGNKIAIDPCSNLTHKINILVIEDELLEEEKQEEQAPKSVLDETVTIRGNVNAFDMGAQWMNIEPGVTGYTYTTTTDGIYMTTTMRR